MAEEKADKSKGDSKALLERIRKHYKAATEADRENRDAALADLKFLHVPGEQWDEWTRRERGQERPMYEFNKTRITVKRVVNDMRANRPQGKVRAVEDGDKPTANVLEGLIRNIWNTADGDTVIDSAAEYQVGAGMGAWRITVDYADNEAFEQTIGIDPIRNPFCLFADPSAQDALKRDANYWILTDKISQEVYEARYPNKEVCSFETDEFDDDHDWQDEEKVRICEYWWKEPVIKRIAMLANGQTVDLAETDESAIAAAGGILKERKVRSHKIMMCIVGGGDALLEGPVEWAGTQFPFVMIYGEYVVIAGRVYWFGLTRFAKDAQRSYNVSRTNAIESVALTPQAKFWATPEQAKGHTGVWAEANRKNFSFMLYNPDAKTGGAPPQRMASADVPVALIQEMQISSDDIKSVTGIYDASLGAQGNETSGKAINARQRQGEIATFNYMDNMAKGIRRTWEILIDLVPKIYDTERSVRILGTDGAEDYAKVNTTDPATGEAINDLARGKYDVTVTVGPSFATLRQEAAEAYTELASRDPMLLQAAGDLVVKAMDLPYSDKIAERYRAMLPPPIQQMLNQGKNVAPEVQAAMAQVDQLMQQVQAQGQMVQQAAAEVDQKGADLTKQIAALDVKRAQFDADVEKKMAQIMKAEAQLILKQAQQGADAEGEKVKTDRESLSAEVQTAVADIQKLAVEFQQQAVATLSQIQAQAQPGVVIANPPKRKVVRVKRVNGELIGESQEVVDGI